MAARVSIGGMARVAVALVLICSGVAVAQESTEAEAGARTIREIRIKTRDVYSQERAEDLWFYALFNALHSTTKEDVVRRELWLREEDRATDEQLDEIARHLRRSSLFGEVEVTPLETGEPGEIDLDIDTRDRLSLLVYATVRTVGGVTAYDASVGEFNLLGTGKRLSTRVGRNDDGEESASLRYVDPQFLGSWHRLATNVGTTEEGHFVTVDLSRPFKHLEDPLSYGVNAFSTEVAVDYFQQGLSFAEVPTARNGGGGFVSTAFGPRDLRGTVGVDASFEDIDYGTPVGPAAAPGDTQRFGLGVSTSVQGVDKYLKLRGIDALDYVEDVTLGTSANARVGLSLRDQDGFGSQVQPVVSGGIRSAVQPLPETYITVQGGASARWHGGRARGWRVGGALHAFQTSLPRQTLAASVRFDAGFETQDLVPQFTLGEDNGLRGYPAREFGGTRVTRLNLENRIDTGLEALSFHVGAVTFVDVGWVHDSAQGLSQGEAIKSVGAGLRFGSSEIFGGNVLRLDFGFPLDDVNGEDYGLSVSFSFGQVFGFFGNSNELRREF